MTDIAKLTIKKIDTSGITKTAESFERLGAALMTVNAEMEKLRSSGFEVTIDTSSMAGAIRAQIERSLPELQRNGRLS